MGAIRLTLGREHLGKIIRLDVQTILTLPKDVFREGDILVFFNNTELFTTLESHIENAYRSSMPMHKSHFEVAPRALVNLVFVADNTVVFTVGV